MPIVCAFPVLVEQLAADHSLLPSVSELRPASCPYCGQPALPPGKPIGIVGHGTYVRQILGLTPGGQVTIPIRRFACRGCTHTISVLPDEIYPGRLYAAAAVLLSLWLTLTHGRSAQEVRERFGSPGDTSGWKTLRRWRRDLLHRLWGWVASTRVAGSGPCSGQAGQSRLRRLLGRAGIAHTASEDDVAAAARELTSQWPTVHKRSDDSTQTGSG